MSKHSHYFKDVSKLNTVDVYRVLSLFEVSDPCIQHAVKKLLCGGIRGVKSLDKDVQEAIDSLLRYQEIIKENSTVKLVEQKKQTPKITIKGIVLSCSKSSNRGYTLVKAESEFFGLYMVYIPKCESDQDYDIRVGSPISIDVEGCSTAPYIPERVEYITNGIRTNIIFGSNEEVLSITEYADRLPVVVYSISRISSIMQAMCAVTGRIFHVILPDNVNVNKIELGSTVTVSGNLKGGILHCSSV